MKSISEAISFELTINKQQNSFPDTIKTILTQVENMMLFLGIDVVGGAEELFKNDEFIYYLKMVTIERVILILVHNKYY